MVSRCGKHRGCRGSIWFHDIVDRCFATVSTSAEVEGPARSSTSTANDPAIGYNLHATLARIAVGPPPNLRVHTVVATLSIERLRRLCRFRRTAFGLVRGV